MIHDSDSKNSIDRARKRAKRALLFEERLTDGLKK
jgi:hypothetical protein